MFSISDLKAWLVQLIEAVYFWAPILLPEITKSDFFTILGLRVGLGLLWALVQPYCHFGNYIWLINEIMEYAPDRDLYKLSRISKSQFTAEELKNL